MPPAASQESCWQRNEAQLASREGRCSPHLQQTPSHTTGGLCGNALCSVTVQLVKLHQSITRLSAHRGAAGRPGGQGRARSGSEGDHGGWLGWELLEWRRTATELI